MIKLLQQETSGLVSKLDSLTRMADKLNAMGPGDAFVDTDLRLLAQECIDWDARDLAAMREQEQAEADATDPGDA